MYDLLIADGTLIDGTGASRRQADLAIEGGRIAEIGRIDRSAARRVIEAEGRVVAPGIVDPHTHYDPQLMLDPFASSSCFHGVTTVVAGNCGFALAPTRATGRANVKQIFSRVEEIDLAVLDRIPWEFETFSEFLAARDGKLGINAAFYVGHCNLRLWVMAEEAYEREARPDEVEVMQRLVRDAMAAGAAGFSSSHSPTDLDALDRPIPSRRASFDELRALVSEVGRANRGTIAYLPFSAVGGLTEEDGELLVRMALESRLPVIIQGLGARSKVDAPTATWPRSKAYLESARERGAAVYSLLISKPFQRTFSLAGGTTLFDGALPFNRLFSEAKSVEARTRMLHDPAYREAIREAVERPNKDPGRGSTLPPPHFDALSVNRTRRPEHQVWVGRTLVEIASLRGGAPMDALVEIALAEDLETEFLWSMDSPEWRDGTHEASLHPQMIIGTSDAGAHLGRDDGAEFSSYFLKNWVREWGRWELEAGIRQLTQVPAAILGLNDRGVLAPGLAGDVMVFDPETVGPDEKSFREDRIPGQTRWTSRPTGFRATIVGGVPIVMDGEICDEDVRPGRVLRPGAAVR